MPNQCSAQQRLAQQRKPKPTKLRRRKLSAERLETRMVLASLIAADGGGDLNPLDEDHADSDHGHEEIPEALRVVESGHGPLVTVLQESATTVQSATASQSIPEIQSVVANSVGDIENAPTSNIQLTSAHLRRGDGTAISNPIIGQMVAVQVNYVTVDLDSDAHYGVEFEVDGVTLGPGDVTTGAGFGNGTWFYWWSGWYASPGEHTVHVRLDPDNTVIESNESDNNLTFTFTPVVATDLMQKFAWPV